MADLQTRRLTAEIRSIDEKNHRVTAFVSTRSVDRHSTIFLPEAYVKHLVAYLERNPIFLWGHLWHGPPTAALGTAVEGRVVPNEGLELTFEYAVEDNPVADLVWRLVVRRVIRAFSVGVYILGEVTARSPKEEIAALPEYARQALVAGECDSVYTEAELIEVSQVLIGSNRDALTAAIDEGVVPREFALRALAGEQLDHVLDQIVRSAAALDTSRLAVRQNGGSPVKIEASDIVPAERMAQSATTATRMPVEAIDNASRLETAAMCLRACNWYDDDDEDKIETCEGILKILSEVGAYVQSIMPTATSGEEPTGEEPAATTSAVKREGKKISAANAAKLRDARDKCMEAVGHMDDLLNDDEKQTDEEGDDAETAGAPDAYAAALARALADLNDALKK